MFFKYLSEIKSVIPTSKWDDLDGLVSLLEEEEDNHLRPLLGESLFQKLAEDYESMSDSEYWQQETTDKDTARIIRACQKVAVYMMLANNSGLLTVSFNRGGGLNTMTAEDYDTPGTDTMKRFERDAWKKGHRNIDSLLRLLELDAQKTDSKYGSLWKQSRYFYRQANLLFTTAPELQQYLDIADSREKYISLVPDISYAQAVYIQPRIGQPLLDKLLAMKYEPTVEYGSDPLFLSFADKVLSATALYVEASQKDLRRDDSLNRADMQIALACRIIKENPDYFIALIGNPPAADLTTVLRGIPIEGLTPTTVPEASPSGSLNPQPSPLNPQPPTHAYDPRDPHNAVFAPFFPGLRKY